MPWPGGKAARVGGGATRLSSRSVFLWSAAVGGASIGLNVTTGDAAPTLDMLMRETPCHESRDRGRGIDKEKVNGSLQLERISAVRSP